MNGTQILVLGGLLALYLRPWEWNHSHARTRREPVRHRAKSRASSSGDISHALESGEISGTALRDLMASGELRLKKNPDAGGAIDVKSLSPEDRKAFNSAKRLAVQFHGDKGAEVIELDPDERKLPRFLTVLGEMPELQYETPAGSKRAGWIWEHAAGDRGFGRPSSPNRPVLAADPTTRRPVLVPARSPVRFNGKLGLIG